MADVPPDLDWTRAAPEDATGPGPWIELAFGDDGLVHIRETSDPETVVTTTQKKWDAFVLGVQAGEFDHFVEGVEGPEPPEELAEEPSQESTKEAPEESTKEAAKESAKES